MDLSIESVMALAAMTVALIFGTGGAGGGLALEPAWLAFPVSLAMALAIGIVIGGANARSRRPLGINAFIVTLVAYIFARGVVVALSGGRSVYGLPDAMRVMAIERSLGVPLLAWTLIVVYLVFAFILTKTPFGRHLVMIGGNATATFRAGIRVGGAVTVAFILSGALAGFAGWLLASRTAGATANLGIGMLFQAFAAVVIGGVSLKGGYGRLSGVFAGVLLLSSIQTAINVMGMPPHYTQMIQGGAGARGGAPRHAQDHDPPALSLVGNTMGGRLKGPVAIVDRRGARHRRGHRRALRRGRRARSSSPTPRIEAGDGATGRAASAPRFRRRPTSADGRAPQRIVAEALDRHGRLDILVQNAGIYPWTHDREHLAGGVGPRAGGQPARARSSPRRPR